jgi:putative ABC transport system ATP-binding protein
MNESNHQPLIRLEGVTKVFLTDEMETHALDGIHLEILPGQYISIAGPSGCGKSTLLSILGLLDTPSEGSYILNGKPVEKLKLARWRSKRLAGNGQRIAVLLTVRLTPRLRL